MSINYRVAYGINILVLFILFASCSSNENKLYQSGKVWNYDAEFRGIDSVFHYQIQMIPGGSFLFQQKIKWVVSLPDSVKSDTFLFRSESTTGFIEDESKVWLHPPRTHRFKCITQLAPYPQIQFPLVLGEKITGNINMVGNWGSWNGKSTNYELVLTSKEYSSVYQDSLWVLEGVGNLEKDTASVIHLFSETKGFVESTYKNSRGEYFKMKLEEIVGD